MPDSHRPSIFNPPEEPPLGYEAIRAWLQKPRPRLSRAFGWVRLLLSKLYDAGVFIRKNARPGAEWVQRATEKAKPVVRAGAQIGEGVRNVGKRMSAAAGAFRDPEGKHLGTESKVRRAGDATQIYGHRIAAGSDVAGSVFSLLGVIARAFTPQQPVSIGLREPEGAQEDADETPASDGRILPRRSDKRRPEPAGDRAGRGAKSHQPGADPEPAGEAEETPAETPREPPADDAEETPAETPQEAPANDTGEKPEEHRPPRPTSSHAEENPPELPHEPPTPGDAEEETGGASTAETPEPDPEAASESPARTEPPPPATPPPATPPPATPPPPLEDRFEGVPKVLLPRVEALKERPSPEVLHPLILDICLFREWTTAKQMAQWFSMHRRSLVERHLGRLVDEELLMLRFPNKVRSRKQAYRTNPDKWPPRR